MAMLVMLSSLGCNAEVERRPFGSALPPTPGLDDESESESEGDGESGTTGAAEANEIDDFILGLDHLAIAELVPKTETECWGDCSTDGQEGEEWCSYVHYSETQHAHDLVAFQPNSATLWPGNVVQGQDAEHGILTPIGLPRAPMSFSVSLESLAGSPVGHMEQPSLSAFREERNRILSAGTTGATPAKISYDLHRVYDESQTAVALGGSLEWFGGSLSSMFNYSNNLQATKILVDFTQAYYTIDVDTPGLPSDLFTEEVSLEQIETFMGDDNPPMYVQSITFGRRVIFAVESTHSENEVRFALEAGFNAFLAGAEIMLETQHRTVIEESKMSALVLGGAGSDAVKTVSGFEGLVEYIQAGGDYSQASPGAEIAYKLAYFDNTGVKLALTTDYSERQCYDSAIDVTGELARLEYVGGNDDGATSVDVYGDIMFRIAGAADADPCRVDAPDWHGVFHRTQDGPQEIQGMWVPQSAPREQIFDFAVEPGDNLCLRGYLQERDDCWFCDDDDLGTATAGPIPLSAGWAGDHILEFSADGTVAATVRITVD
jgi:hypothetical protein